VQQSVLDNPTHVIAESCELPEVAEAKDCFGSSVAIVKVFDFFLSEISSNFIYFPIFHRILGYSYQSEQGNFFRKWMNFIKIEERFSRDFLFFFHQDQSLLSRTRSALLQSARLRVEG
jgi:hypothetical protein